MASSDGHAWALYAHLQNQSNKISRLNDCWWGLECGLDYLVSAIAANDAPRDEELQTTVARKIASGARRHRAHVAQLKEAVLIANQHPDVVTAAEAHMEVKHILRLVSSNDAAIAIDVGLGYSDREIADRRETTAGAVRVRISRLRKKLAA